MSIEPHPSISGRSPEELEGFEIASRFLGATTKKPGGRPPGSYGAKALAIRDAVLEFATEYQVMTVRQAFYQCSTRGVVEKTENSGYRPVQDQILRMRREGVLPWEFIADGTRWMRKPDSYDSVEDAITSMHRSYRRNLWQSQGCRVEIWLEKDALAGVISDVTNEWDVPLMVSRGMSSETFLYSAGRTARDAFDRSGAVTHVYALYDFDGYGETAAEKVEAGLRKYSDGTVEFELLALDWRQIVDWDLPTRPIGTRKDGRAKRPHSDSDRIGGGAVELDAIPPDVLCQLVEDAVLEHVDEGAWRLEELAEESEREILERMIEGAA